MIIVILGIVAVTSLVAIAVVFRAVLVTIVLQLPAVV